MDMAGGLGSRLLEMLHNDHMTDFTFVVQGTEIKCHQLIISSRRSRLKHLMTTSNNSRVDIGDAVSCATFNNIIRYLYTDECEVSESNISELLKACMIFNLAYLESYCSNVVRMTVNDSNVREFTSIALKFKAKATLKVCQEYFGKHAAHIVKRPEFLTIPYETLLGFCSCDSLNCSELVLFSSCVEWAKANCARKKLEESPENLRAVLGDVVNKIRFPCITSQMFDDFLTVVVPSKVLTFDEIGRIIVDFEARENHSPFSDVDRTEPIEVTIQSYSDDLETSLMLPLSTTIYSLKEMKIWNNGNEMYPPNLFSLSHKGEVLDDNDTLATIYNADENLVLEVSLVCITLTSTTSEGNWKTLAGIEIKEADVAVRFIKGFLYSKKGFDPTTTKLYINDNLYVDTIPRSSLKPGLLVEIHHEGS